MGSSSVYDLIIIGAGAAGCFAAITAAMENKSVLLLEKNPTVAKKILATGNGRCNFTNRKMSDSCYHGNHALISHLLSQLSVDDVLQKFHELGISSYERDGYYYPLSNQAKSVVVAFENAIYKNNVDLVVNCCVDDCYIKNKLFEIDAKILLEDSKNQLEHFSGKNLLIATGLLNSAINGIEKSMFQIINDFGHHINPILPALCGYECSGIPFKKIAGIRSHGTIQLFVDGQFIAEDTGELQFNEYGVSGIPVFQLSALTSNALHDSKNVEFHIDFMPDVSFEELEQEVNFRINNFKNPLNGLIPDKLIYLMDSQMNHKKDAFSICTFLKNLTISCDRYRDYKFSQTCTGGVSTDELKEFSLESALVDGLYFAGELLDIDGICGGYNLHMAWESGYFVGKNIRC